ncbi:MAG: hypothetical protein WD773_11345 [Gemmatimonadales bacterium]
MRSTWFNRAAGRALLLALLTATIDVPAAAARPVPNQPRRPRAANLFAAAGLLLDVNRQVCGLANTGQVCVAFAGSPVGGGGFWPKGTPDQYIFQSGIQLAGVIPNIPGFPWSGDTVGAFFVDTRGTQEQGDGLSLIYNSLNSQDVAQWPNGAIIRDTSLFSNVLIGRKSASQGDSWVREWEGDPSFLSGRTHPMGIAIDQRSLAWNYPSGNEDILYFIFTFYNISARASSGKYNNPTIDPALQAEIGAIGDRFQDLNEQRFSIAIPDTGYTITSLHSAFTMDADVAVFSTNYSTAVLPFNLAVTYAGDFLPEVGWQFPPDIFGSPFYAAPGFVGVKYLRSPESSPGNQVGLTMFSTFVNLATGFPDPVGVRQLYRYLSGTLGDTDNPCNSSTDPAVARALKLCFIHQDPQDSRFFEASGPFDLPPGEARTIVVAYVLAAPLAAPLLVLPGGGPGGDNPPGFPASGDSIFTDPTKVLPIERVMGWVSHSDLNGNSRIEQSEVVTAPRSLLNKALVAQAVFDNKFLLPFAPEAPQFFLVPGDNQVTVVWQQSVSETTGDPYFAVASAPTVLDPAGNPSPNPLYDPNFRQFDVEGYRIYRGRTAGQLELIAQFDYDGTRIVDFTGGFDYPDADGDGLLECAPELGLQDDCPVTFATSPPYVESETHSLTGRIIQIPPGGRVELASGSVLNLKADTAVTGGPPACAGQPCPELTSGGVPFAFVDRNVRNSFTYHYTVTAFDVNSIVSGPTSLESPRITKPVVPRSASGQETAGVLQPQELLGADGAVLNAAAPLPTIDPATAIFSGPMPPTDGIDVGLAAFLPQVLGNGSLTVMIDSIDPGYPSFDFSPGRFQPTVYYLTGQGAGAPVPFTVALEQHQYEETRTATSPFEATAIDSAKSARFGGNQTFSLFGQVTLTSAGAYRTTMWGRADINADPANSSFNGPRWWTGAANENTPDPNGGSCPTSPVNCGAAGGPQPTETQTAGAMPGVQIFHPRAYNTVPNSPLRLLEAMLATVMRAADFRVYWGTGGTIDSVRDVTHRVPVPFDTRTRASWGLLTQASFAATDPTTTGDGDNAMLTWADVFCPAPAPAFSLQCGGAGQAAPAVLQQTATLTPIALSSSAYADADTLAATGNGFIFYLNGHFFLMQMATLPAAGDVWNARFYTGTVTGSAAGGDFAYEPTVRPPAVPGLRVRVVYQGSAFDPSTTTAASLERIHTVPDPYYVTNALEFTQNTKVLKFVNMPSRAVVRIYSVSGVLVRVLAQDDPTGGGELTWNLRNRNNQFVASGVYFYHVETPDGKSKVGRFTVVNFAP